MQEPVPGDQAQTRVVRSWSPRLSLFFLLLTLMLVALFEVLRAGLILRNWSSANSATVRQLASTFWYGLRFDLAISFYITLPVIVVGCLPGIGLWHSRRLRRIVFWTLVTAVTVLIFILLAEFEFFREFQTRYNQLAFQYLDQPKIVVGMVWYNYPVVRYVLVCLVLGTAWGLGLLGIMRLCFGRGVTQAQPVRPVGELGQLAVMILLAVIGIRGGLQTEPLRWGDAYHSSNEFVNQMSLNGLFALAKSGRDQFRHRRSSAWLHRMPADQAKSIARTLIVAPDETLLDPAGSTVLRRTEKPTPGLITLRKPQPGVDRPPNVVLVLMESFSARYVGACGSTPDYTPSFDALAADGVLFDHAFSGGMHTHQGVFCSMLGFPNLPGLEYLMQDIVSNQPFLTLPTVLKKQGYQTLFLYNGNLAWDNMRGFFRKQGIDQFVGSPDYVEPIHRDRVWGVTDQDVFDRANKEFEAANAKGPFFSLILTLSNHAPFDLPEPLAFSRTTDMGESNKRIDAVRYADWAVGHFIEEAKKLKYFDNTLFVFVGDHGFHVPPVLTESRVLFHHVPLLFYSPLLDKKGVKISSAAGQVNIIPSILGLLGSTEPQASWGRNLFGKHYSDENFVIFKGSGGAGSDKAIAMIRGDNLLVVGSEGSTELWKYSLNPDPSIQLLEDPASALLRDRMRLELDGYIQSAMSDLTNHRVAVKPTTRPEELLQPISGN